MTPAPAPSSSKRSGTKTPIVPPIIPGTRTSQPPVRTRGSPSARRSPAKLGRSPIAGASVPAAQAARPTPSTAIAENTAPRPTWSASPPTAGPNRAPTIAAPRAEPISSPRRSAGPLRISQASAPAHEAAPPTPSTKRAMSSKTMSCAKAKAILEADISPSPSKTVRRTPNRAASQPPGKAAIKVPAA